jgi:hypothetical protein
MTEKEFYTVEDRNGEIYINGREVVVCDNCRDYVYVDGVTDHGKDYFDYDYDGPADEYDYNEEFLCPVCGGKLPNCVAESDDPNRVACAQDWCDRMNNQTP